MPPPNGDGLAVYEELIRGVPDIERKGKNGARLSKEERTAFLEAHPDAPCAVPSWTA
jgi:hypothetical protein